MFGSRVGFMQGRLSPLVDGKIQAFPWDHWESEFAEASRLDLGLIEWTLDQHRLYDNPIMTVRGREEVRALAVANGIEICLLYTSPSPRDVEESRMPSSA